MKSEANLRVEHHTLPECRDGSFNPGASAPKSGPKSAMKPPSRGSPNMSKDTQSATSAKVQNVEQFPHPKQVSKSLSTANLRHYFKALKHMSNEEQRPACFSSVSLQNSTTTEQKISDF